MVRGLAVATSRAGLGAAAVALHSAPLGALAALASRAAPAVALAAVGLAVSGALGCAPPGAAGGGIHVDQAGYPAAAAKLAMVVVDPPAERFAVHRLGEEAPVLTGELGPPRLDPDSGDRVQVADLSAVAAPGRYEVRVPGLEASPSFPVAADPYREVLRLAARSYYGQRCGTAVDLAPDHPGYAHGPCHLGGGFHASAGDPGDRSPPRGGWHDAGDYGRYVVNSGIATGTLLWAWELYPGRFADLDLGLPESGDATPDLLDEVRWNLEWMLAMQDADGGAWHKQTSPDFPGFVAPEEDPLPSLVIGTGGPPYKSTCATADLAAVAAIAGRVYRPFDEAFATRCTAAARRAWDWLGEHPAVGFVNPDGVVTGEYGDEDCDDERAWAAAELWRTTGDEAFHRFLLDRREALAAAVGPASPPSWQRVGPLAAWTYLLDGAGDAALGAELAERSLAAANAVAGRLRDHPYRIPLIRDDYVWGSNGVAANYALQLLVADRLRPDPRHREAALDVLHYLLGRNPFGLSWVTGVGERPARHPHHRPSGSDDHPEPWPGLLVGGPDAHRSDRLLRGLPAELPPARAYLDRQGSYASNEVAINWNAPLVLLLAAVVDGEAPGVGGGSEVAGGKDREGTR